MWFDNSKNAPIQAKARMAIARARERLGAVNVCYVDGAQALDGEIEVEGVPVIGAGCIPPGYLWVGWENERGQALPSRAARQDAEQLSYFQF
jgi:hypothetical protein